MRRSGEGRRQADVGVVSDEIRTLDVDMLLFHALLKEIGALEEITYEWSEDDLEVRRY